MGMVCDGEVLVTNGAVLTIEPGATICVNKIRASEGGRIVALGTAGEPIYFGVRSRADHWQGLQLQPPANGGAMTGTSVLTHAVIENASAVEVAAHPIIVEDALVRRVVPAARTDYCATFSIQQHGISGIEPSRVLRTVVDGLGAIASAYWDYGSCPALHIRISDGAPLVVSTRVINSRGFGVELSPADLTAATGQTRLTDCEISGSAFSGLLAGFYSRTYTLPQVTSCNVVGNVEHGVANGSGTQPLDARGNWWGDPAGPGGPQGEGVEGNVDASNPLALPLQLGY
jgi:hypothetical protein